MSISETLKTRLKKDRPMTSITLRIPVDVVESMKNIAPRLGFAGYQSLLKAYLSEGLRRDEQQFDFSAQARLLESLRKHGVAQSVLDEATRDLEVIVAIDPPGQRHRSATVGNAGGRAIRNTTEPQAATSASKLKPHR